MGTKIKINDIPVYPKPKNIINSIAITLLSAGILLLFIGLLVKGIRWAWGF